MRAARRGRRGSTPEARRAGRKVAVPIQHRDGKRAGGVVPLRKRVCPNEGPDVSACKSAPTTITHEIWTRGTPRGGGLSGLFSMFRWFAPPATIRCPCRGFGLLRRDGAGARSAGGTRVFVQIRTIWRKLLFWSLIWMFCGSFLNSRTSFLGFFFAPVGFWEGNRNPSASRLGFYFAAVGSDLPRVRCCRAVSHGVATPTFRREVTPSPFFTRSPEFQGLEVWGAHVSKGWNCGPPC